MLKIFVISLEHDVQKREIIKNKLESFSLDYEFINATYGRDLPSSFKKGLVQSGKLVKRSFKATDGEIGCTLSHALGMKKIIEQDLKWACILEDDVEIDDKFKDFCISFNQNNTETQKLYLLGGQEGLITRKFIVRDFFNKDIIANNIFFRVKNSEKYVNRACCYVVSQSFATRYITLLAKNFFLADDWLYLKNNSVFNKIYLSNFVKHPQDLSKSNLECERFNEGKKKGFKGTFIYKFLVGIYLFFKMILIQFKIFIP